MLQASHRNPDSAKLKFLTGCSFKTESRQAAFIGVDCHRDIRRVKADCSLFLYFFLPIGSFNRCGGKSRIQNRTPRAAMLPQLDVRHLCSVVILAEELNFTRAAHRLRISQPALSRQITELERQHGFQLFTRDRKRAAQLTEAGRTFVEEARSALLHA